MTTIELNYKEDGDVLYGSDLRENLSFGLVNMINYALDGVTVTSQENFIMNDSQDSGNTTLVSGGSGKWIYDYTVVDNLNDDSFDTNIWSKTETGGGTVTEQNSRLELTCAADNSIAGVTADQSNAKNFKVSSTDFEVRLTITAASTHDGSTGNFKFYLTDGSNTVNIYNKHNSGAVATGQLILYIDKSANTADLYIAGNSKATNVDISSLTGSNWYFGFSCGKNYLLGNPTYMYVTTHTYLQQNDSTEKQFQSNGETASATVTTAIMKVVTISNASGSTISLSADGTNFETVTDKTLHEFTNTGTNIKTQVKLKGPTTITADGATDNRPYFDDYALYYG